MSKYGSETVGKVYIDSVDDPGAYKVIAQYNPKELQVDRTVPWSPTGEANKDNKEAAKKSSGIHLEFTGAQGRTLTLELLFDEYEAAEGGEGSVAANIKNLEKLASVRQPGSKEEDFRRPHQCNVVWGSTLQGFLCVIESLSTKYTMFSPKGAPLRATCTVKLKEAQSVSAKAEEKKGGGGKGGAGKGGAGGKT